MRDGVKTPVVIGVTGHRDLRGQDKEKLRAAVRGELEALHSKCPHSPLLLLTGLAEGADRLCAETALQMGIEIISILPMPISEYIKDFADAGEQDRLMYLTEASSEVFVSPVLEPYDKKYGTERDWLYRQAGLYIAKHSHVLIALWDGSEGDECGCGTASVAGAMLSGSFGEAGSAQLHPDDRMVIQIVTPRAKGSGAEKLTAGEVVRHGDPAVLDMVLKDTDIFNSDCEKQTEAAGPEGAVASHAADGDSVLARLRSMYDAADALSVENSIKHTGYLARLSVTATALAMAFLIYDEADWYFMIAVCGVIICILFLINHLGNRSKYQARYLEYRVLAEHLRVQYHLRSAGVACEVSGIMPWNLQLTMPWIRCAVSAAMIGRPAQGRRRIKENWVLDQKEYHERALVKSLGKMKSNDRILRIALIMTLAIYAFALIFELGFGGKLIGDEYFSPRISETIRMYIKIAMGTAAAGTLFAGNYYGKLALPNVIDDHRKMAALYEKAADEIDRQGESEELLVRLAEDELNENANWYAYQSKSEPDLGI